MALAMPAQLPPLTERGMLQVLLDIAHSPCAVRPDSLTGQRHHGPVPAALAGANCECRHVRAPVLWIQA